MRNNTEALIAKAHSVQQVIRLAMQHEMNHGSKDRDRIAKIAAARIGKLQSRKDVM